MFVASFLVASCEPSSIPDGSDAEGSDTLFFHGPERGRQAVEAIRAFHALCTATGGSVDIARERWFTDPCVEDMCGRLTRCAGGGFTGAMVCRCPPGTGWDVLDGCRPCSLGYDCDDVAARLRSLRACTAHTDCLRCLMGIGACECAMSFATAGPLGMHARFTDLEILKEISDELHCEIDVCGCDGYVGCEDGQCAYEVWEYPNCS